MRKIAPHSAEKGRLRPSFFFWGSAMLLCAVAGTPVLAQEQVYRCGQEYTNAPKEASRCERLSPQSVTVIPGLKPARMDATAPSAQPVVLGVGTPAAVAPAPSGATWHVDAPQRQRDQQARTIVATELERTRQRHAELVQEYRQGAPAKTEADAASPQKYQARVAQLKAAIERHERDMDSLQRELARRPAP